MLCFSSPSTKPLPLLSKPTTFSTPRRGALTVRATASTPPAAATMYEILAVEATAGPDEIKAAYRRQARRWHPDACPSRADADKRLFSQRFMEARHAYEVLSDPAARQCYDHELAAGAGGGGRGSGGFADWESQLEGLRRRAAARGDAAEATWGSRMRRDRH